jgi:hypothetical protein
VHQCHKCGAAWVSTQREPGVKETCEACHAYLHACLNCRHHRRGLPNQCYIPNTEAVADRAGCNFCDDFEFRSAPEAESGEAAQARARGAAAELLGGAADTAAALREDLLADRPEHTDPRKGLDALFGE